MTSIRNSESVATTSESRESTADRLLDAARESILSVGWRRTTLTDVARRAGVSRMTLYRTYDDMTALFGDLMTREWAEVVAGVEDEHDQMRDPADWPAGLASRLVGAVRELRTNDLFTRIVDVDPELLLPYLLGRRGRSQEAVLDLLTAGIAEGQAAGGVRRGDPVLLARTLLLAAHGFVLSAHTMTDERVGVEALDREFAELVERTLAC